MKLELKPSGVIDATWVMEVDLRIAPKCITIRVPDYYSEFTVDMDRAFIYPFECRRIGSWLKVQGKPKSYWTHVILPEGYD